MDIEKLIEQLRYLADTPSYTAFHDAKEREIICDQCEADFCYDKQQDAHWCMYEALSRAATALSTLQAENERLRKELEYEREHANAYHEECGQWEAENEKLRAELEQKEKYYEQMIDALSATDSADLAQMTACVYYKPGGLCRYGGDDPANVCVLGPCPHERTAEEVLADLARVTAERDAAIAAVKNMAEYIVCAGRVDYYLCDEISQEHHLKYQPKNDGNYDNEPCYKCIEDWFLQGNKW